MYVCVPVCVSMSFLHGYTCYYRASTDWEVPQPHRLKHTHTQVKTQVNRQWAPLECQSHTQFSAKLHTEKCQCPVAGSRPAFPSPALQNPAQIFPGSDTSLALGSFLHVERNCTTRTALKWEWISRSGNADCWAFLEEQKCIDLYKSVEVMFHFAVVLVSGAHLPHLLLRNKESGV